MSWQRKYSIPFVVITLLQLGQLFLYTPVYELDINYYLKGALHWDINHPPFYNVYLSVLHKIYPSVYLPVMIQLLTYCFVSSWLIVVLFDKRAKWVLLLAAIIAGIEPTASFYNVSLLTESLFLSITLVMLGCIVKYCETADKKYLWAMGVGLGLAFSLRYLVLLYVPVFVGFVLWNHRKEGYLIPTKTIIYLIPLFSCISVVWVGQRIITNVGIFNQTGKLRWDNCAQYYKPEYCKTTGWICRTIDYEKDSGYFRDWTDYEQRFRAGNIIKNKIANTKISNLKLGDDMADMFIGIFASEIEKHHYWEIRRDFLVENTTRLLTNNFLEYRYNYKSNDPVHQDIKYLDSLMVALYNFPNPPKESLNPFWINSSYINTYAIGMWILALFSFTWFVVRFKKIEVSALWLFLFWFVPIMLLIFTIIPYKLRFVCIYFLPLIFFVIRIVRK